MGRGGPQRGGETNGTGAVQGVGAEEGPWGRLPSGGSGVKGWHLGHPPQQLGSGWAPGVTSQGRSSLVSSPRTGPETLP